MNAFFVLAQAIAIGIAVHPVVSVKYYNCKSDTAAECSSGDPAVLKQFELDCNLGVGLGVIFSRCATSIQSGVTSRSCIMPVAEIPDNSCVEIGADKVCICTADLCNTHTSDGNGVASPNSTPNPSDSPSTSKKPNAASSTPEGFLWSLSAASVIAASRLLLN